MLRHAIDRSKLNVVETLFDGRRWCNPEHDDICFAYAFERTTKLVEEISSKAEEAIKRKIGADEVSDWLRKNHVVELFNLLPIAFRTTQTALVSQIRQLALACYNEHDDSKGSHAILVLCKEFRFKSVELNERLAKDYSDIEEILRAEKQILLFRAIEDERQRRAAWKAFEPLLGLVMLFAIGACISGIGWLWDFATGSKSKATPNILQQSITQNATAKPMPRGSSGSESRSSPKITNFDREFNRDQAVSQTSYRVPTYITSELDRDSKAIEREKAKAEKLGSEFDTLNRELERERLYLDRTNAWDVDRFNEKIERCNAIVERAKIQQQAVNVLVDNYNQKLRTYGR